VLSVNSLGVRLVFAITGPFIGWITDTYTLQTAMITSGCLFLCCGIMALFFLRRQGEI